MIKTNSPLIYIVTGEASGDLLGSRLMKALKKLCPDIRFEGVGGTLMCQEGLRTLFPAQDLSVMGLLEILPHLAKLSKRLHQTEKDILKKEPDLVLTIDSPGFNFRLARLLKKDLHIPLFHYTAPSVWAWKPGRARKISKLYDHLFALFKFEPPYFEKENLPCTFIGHPLIEEKLPQISPNTFRRLKGVPQEAPLLCLLPGSRQGEVTHLLPYFANSVFLLQKNLPDLTLVCPTLPAFKKDIETVFQGRIPLLFTNDKQEKYLAMAASNAALAASGTVSLELALTKTPMVIGYRLNPLTYFIIKKLVKAPYACLVNILLKEKAVPEYLQNQCTPENLYNALLPLLQNPLENQIRQRLDEIPLLLKNELGDPSYLAAKTILGYIQKPL
tara:strand:- start:649 stop:1809 length:1161 start_codon:yes stop_codon:yes gene_type:complete